MSGREATRQEVLEGYFLECRRPALRAVHERAAGQHMRVAIDWGELAGFEPEDDGRFGREDAAEAARALVDDPEAALRDATAALQQALGRVAPEASEADSTPVADPLEAKRGGAPEVDLDLDLDATDDLPDEDTLAPGAEADPPLPSLIRRKTGVGTAGDGGGDGDGDGDGDGGPGRAGGRGGGGGSGVGLGGGAGAGAVPHDLPSPVTAGVTNAPVVGVRQLDSNLIGDMATARGVVNKATESQTRLERGAFRCDGCGEVVTVEWDPIDGVSPPGAHRGCDANGTFELDLKHPDCEFADLQRVDLQERPEAVDTKESAASIEVRMPPALVDHLTGGERAEVTGILRAVEDDGGGYKRVLDAVGIERENRDIEDYDITPEDEQEIRAIAEADDTLEMFVDSLAPRIRGRREMKRAIVLALVGGTPKRLTAGGAPRSEIHVLLIGDPGTGKSVLINRAAEVAPIGVPSSGTGSSAAGLTAAAVRDNFGDDEWSLEAGTVVLADRGVAAVDELDTMDKSEREALLEALEQQEVTVAKAGINTTLKARCSMVAAANPEYGRFDEYEPIPQQFDLSPPILSRFDLIFVVRDRPDPDQDGEIAGHTVDVNRAAAATSGLLADHGYNPREEDAETVAAAAADADVDADGVDQPVDNDLFTKYIAYARQRSHPHLSEAAGEHIRQFYVAIRNGADPDDAGGGSDGDGGGGGSGGESNTIPDDGDASPVPVTARKIEAIIRLAEASARLNLRDEVTLEDAQLATDLARTAMEAVGVDPETGELDADVVETGRSRREQRAMRSVKDILGEMQSADPGDDVVAHLDEGEVDTYKSEGWPPSALAACEYCEADTESAVVDTLEELKDKGEVYTPSGKIADGVVPLTR